MITTIVKVAIMVMVNLVRTMEEEEGVLDASHYKKKII